MHARIAEFEHADVSRADELIDTVRGRAGAARAQLPDAREFLMLIDRESGRSLALTLFESEDAIRGAEQVFERLGDELPEELRGRRVSVDVYEVIRHDHGEGAKAARITSFEGSPDRVAEGIRRAERAEAMAPFSDVLPRAEQMPGWKGYFWLVDRPSGRTKMITLFDSAESLGASERRADELRRQAAESTGDTVTGVERYEVALSEQLAAR